MTENARYQAAKACAGEALEALYSVYWADSFDGELLEHKLAETIHIFTQGARCLAESELPNFQEFGQFYEDVGKYPVTEVVDRSSPPLVVGFVEEEPSLLTTSVCDRALLPAEDLTLTPKEGSPSPDILRLLAIGVPGVVNSCVMTLFRLGYARPEEWSPQLPAANPGEVMRILTKRMVSSD
jgi:hypothetical protein